MTITARYIDTCLSSYLQDGCNREGQILLCASLGCTAEEMRDELVRSACDQMGDIPGSIEDSEIDAAVDAALVGVDLRYIDGDGNRQAEPADDRDDEEPYVYVVLEWTPCDHDPVWASVACADSCDGIVDITCRNCGASGSTQIAEGSINW
jgi:hypothetical protein